jgi:RNA polymerase sigma factor (sigma-70 family)
MDRSRLKEEEFRAILDNYAQYMIIQVQRYNLPKYGLDPDDILQEVKIRIWNLIRTEKTILSPASYIKKIVNSSVIDQLRKRRREDNLFRHERQVCISEQGQAYCWEAIRKKAFQEAVGQAVERLIDSRRQVVKLYLLNLTIQDISSYLNWSHDKTRNLLYRGLADLRQSLKDMESKNENRR